MRHSRWDEPRSAKVAGEKRFALTKWTGLFHQVIMRLGRPAIAMLEKPTTPNLVASQRDCVTLWVHAVGTCGSNHGQRAVPPEDPDQGRDDERERVERTL